MSNVFCLLPHLDLGELYDSEAANKAVQDKPKGTLKGTVKDKP